MIKIYVRAIVPTEDSYILMGDHDKTGEQTWDLPGGELQPGVDVKQLLRKLVQQHTGYRIAQLKFFEITCKIKPRARGQEPVTILDFIFTSTLEDASREPAEKEIDLLRFEQFEWLESGGKFRENKVIGLLSRYHRQRLAHTEKHLHVDMEPTTE